MEDKYKLYPLDTRFKAGSDGTIIGAKGKPMVPSKDSDGRLHVMLGRNKNQVVHIIVAMAWLPNPNNYPEVNHKDGNPANNNVKNLEWCTKKQNTLHAVQMGLYKRGTNHYKVKLDEIQVKAIRSIPKHTLTNIQISNYFNVNRTTIYSIRKGINWKHTSGENLLYGR